VLGLLSKEFTIDDGSSITFRGDVSDALFDIKAVYGQRVNLSTLTGTLSATDSQKPVLVENVIKLSGNLQAPEIDFDLRLPNADQSVQEEVFAYIDRNNERDMLNQTVSLLLFKKFYNSSTSTDANAGGTSAAEEGYGFVANTLGGMVSDMVDFVDINFAYQAGNALTTEQYAVDISKEWNKFYFESTFGFGGEAREMSGVGGNNNMTGDMLVGYKINPRLHLFVFNRSNTNDYTRSDLPYKQGVGLKYTRDFDRIVELLGRKEKRK
ncbi:MAG: translocation/assembly module TamB domain-containing protein, partial [Bacteroidales bacterium]|nr:translocation/assembly module TamB domain-containing protein [Bacteroidales bacterium]